MNHRWRSLVGASLVAFAILVIAWQFVHYDDTGNPFGSVAQSFLRGKQLAAIPDIVNRDSQITTASGINRKYDLIFPKDVRVFMTEMCGPTNYNKIGQYYWTTYYLFPREIETSLDHTTRFTKDGFLGRTSGSDQEILTNGFDIRKDMKPDGGMITKSLHGIYIGSPVNPDWFDSTSDLIIAFLLPLLTALAGMWLLRLLFPALIDRLPLLGQLGCGMGLGMMAVAALTLGVKLCGFSGQRLILSLTGIGGIAEVWHNLRSYVTEISGGFRTLIHTPVAIAISVAALFVFLILFRLAGLQGLVEYDAVAGWSLKAKIMHLYTGTELVQWFSNPRLAHAHLDYPTLVPSLHAATYDSLGHVDEFVTKFWPTWMLFFLLAALASLSGDGKSRFHARYFGLLGVLLLPATQQYVQREGGTLPMIFFTVMGFVHCALWLIEKKRVRLGLGLTLLFGAAMAKFEGFIILALMGGWMLLLPSARPSFKPSPRLWPVLAFCFLAALPFVGLLVQIPSLHYESGWAGYALHHPGSTLANCPWIFMVLFARLFVNPGFASWSGEGGQLHWNGRWNGFSSLYNHSTLGLAWFCLLLMVALWFSIPARRPVILWMLAMLVGTLAAFSLVFASLSNVTDLVSTIGYTADNTAGRYLLPMLLAWFATLMIAFGAETSSSASTPS